jgi:capsular exopolysaccharide synthesis family protein
MGNIVPYNGSSIITGGDMPGQRPSGYDGYSESEPEVRGLKEYLAIVRRQWWIVLLLTVVCGGIATWMVFTAPPRYSAVSVVRLADTRRALTGGGEVGAYEGVLGREADVLLSQIQVLMSRQNVGRVVDAEGLRLAPVAGQPYLAEVTGVAVEDGTAADTVRLWFAPGGVTMKAAGQVATSPYGLPVTAGGIRLLISSRPAVSTASFRVISRNDAISGLLDQFKATPRPKTDVIDLQFISGEPHYAQRVANAMARTFQTRNTENAQQTSHRRRVFLEEQIKQTDAMLERAMAAYSSFRSGAQVFSSREKASAQQEGIVNVEMRRADLDAQRRTYKALLAQSQKNSQASEAGLRALVSSPGIAANPVIQQLYAQLTNLEIKQDSLTSAGAASTNPDLVAVSSLISSTTQKLMAAVRNQIQSLDAQIDALDNLKARSTAEIAAAPGTETEEARLAQQVQTIQKMSDALQQDYQKARMSEAVEAGQVEIVDLADIPTFPMSAGRSRKLALGVIIGMMLGVGLAVVIDGMNSSIRRRDDIERVLQVPGLAVIPQFGRVPTATRMTRALQARSKNGKARDRATGLVTVHDASSAGAEAYRTLRTNLIFSQSVQSLRTIVVTSAAPSEGKTTTAGNMAVSFAQQGMRVLIVDCDLRRSRLHKLFGIPREPGLTEFVLGQLDQDAVVRETAVAGLYVLPSGQLPPNPAELLGGNKMRDALGKLTEAFDLVVLDTPPLLAASDAAILATLADGVVMVVRAGVTEIEAGQQAIQQLASVGARVVGAVLNDPDAKVQKYGGYYNYEYASDRS